MKKSRSQNILEEKFIGQEPKKLGDDLVDNDTRITEAFNWYTRARSVEDLRIAIEQYILKNQIIFGKEAFKSFTKVKDRDISITDCSIAQMINNGNLLPERLINRLRNTIKFLISEEQKKSSEKKQDPEAYQGNPQEAMKRIAGTAIGEIENLIDINIDSDTKIDLNQFLLTKEIAGKVANHIVAWFDEVRQEYFEAYSKKDKDLSEAYKFLSKAKLKQRVKYYENLVSQLEQYIGTQKKPRKPRKKRKSKNT